jgi:hypothetical protein
MLSEAKHLVARETAEIAMRSFASLRMTAFAYPIARVPFSFSAACDNQRA